MCNQSITLAEISPLCRVTCCAHNYIHLHWKRASITLNKNDFEALTHLMERAAADDLSSRYLMRADDGRLMVAMGDIAFRLLPADADQFGAMLEEAAARLGGAEPEALAAARQMPGPVHLPLSPN